MREGPTHSEVRVPTAVIVTARCSRSREWWGIRMEQQGEGRWVATWSFALKERTAKREGYDRTQLSGEFLLAPEFPGCAHCKGERVVKCACGGVGCHNGEGTTFTCPWCEKKGKLEGTINSLAAGGDR